ncbi:MAG: hypothetical protein CML69_07175 [Rhodobacteraceae bacterium]|nr:hypothetical protein [Paracoccaceae bacterium]
MSAMLSAVFRSGRVASVLLGWALFTIVAVIMGPFNTLSLMETGTRVLFWGVIVAAGLIASGAMNLVFKKLHTGLTGWRCDLLRVCGITLVLSPVLYVWIHFIIVDPSGMTPNLLRISLCVALVGLIIQVSKRLLVGDQGSVQAQEMPAAVPSVPQAPPPPAPPAPRLMRRLPAEAEGPVLRLSANNHFVEVVLPGEAHRLRMRFTDAIDEMDSVEGHCAHRSHWVAVGAITDVQRAEGRIFLILANGDKIPVSRTYRPGLEQAGQL